MTAKVRVRPSELSALTNRFLDRMVMGMGGVNGG
jgi:hypothetical protein